MDKEEIRNRLTKIIELSSDALRLLEDDRGKDRGRNIKTANVTKGGPIKSQKYDYTRDPRYFFSDYAKGLSGDKCFALVLAFLCKGNRTKNITASEIVKCWDENEGAIGRKKYGIFATRAKNNGWVKMVKTEKNEDAYQLTENWAEIRK